MRYNILHFLRAFALLLTVLSTLLIQSCKKEPEILPVTSPTVQGLAKLFTDSVSDLSNFSVTFRGKILDQGVSAVSESGMVVDTVSNATISKNLNKFKATPDASGQMKVIVTYVPEGTTYYMRTYAVNSAGTAYGNEVVFHSPEGKSTLETFEIKTQEQLVALGAKHYTSVQSLRIGGTVSDLSPLKDLAFVTGGMEISGTSLLKDFSGLEHLEMVGTNFPNSLRLEGNRGLISLKGLNKLKMVRGYFYILSNPLLTDLKGLDSYTMTNAGEFRVDNCASLRSLDGIESMIYCYDGLAIMNNPLLNDLKALRNLKGTTGIIIGANSTLTNLNGLEGLTQVGIGDLEYAGITLQGNPLLTSLEGLRNISKCGNLNINGNASLRSLNGLNALSELNYVQVTNNTSLADLQGLNGLKTVNNNLKIWENHQLANMEGLQKLEKVGRLDIVMNKGIKDLSGLDGLKSVTGPNGYAITISHNENLLSLHGLEQLGSSTEGIQIMYNKNLADFCPLKLLMSSYKSYFSALDNKIKMDPQILQSSCK
ncbi:hypothetical protein [Pedobacter sp. SG908]|uniref:hypothetical protein n=1 Tax=Pedobacter sp. SG908 TaxID=2587135 RepID=UPI001420BB56|nr:hypothetical protein [Pedobacter sp. SG908]NII83185.1 hypothetical protein [Pedobacter sp. SG908]